MPTTNQTSKSFCITFSKGDSGSIACVVSGDADKNGKRFKILIRRKTEVFAKNLSNIEIVRRKLPLSRVKWKKS